MPAPNTRATVGTTSSVADLNTVQTLLAAREGRLRCSFYNDSTVDLYLKPGPNASTTDFTVKVAAGGYFEDVGYVGIWTGIWASDASGSCRVTEYV